ESDEEDTDDRESYMENLVHETVSGTAQDETAQTRSKYYAPEGETKAQRDERTLFVGNLSPSILKAKSPQKVLKRHILSFAPASGPVIKIESIRFRSVAFKDPTNLSVLKEKESKVTERSSNWKDKNTEDDHDQAKAYLSPAEKKRIAFIKREFHEEGASVNAYVVFAYPEPQRKASLPPVMDPFQVVTLMAEKMNGSSLMDRTLRVDRVGASRDGQTDGERDPSSTVFVGNLEFTANEEDVRSFFETLLVSELGPLTRKSEEETSSSSESDSEGENSESGSPDSSHWVHSVRIVRDKDTQLGKGFAYVRFTDRTCVDEIIAMELTKLKFAKRKLRVSRCKSNKDGPHQKQPGSRKVNQVSSSDRNEKVPKTKSSTETRPKAHGDPSLGERLKGMSKEERREVKKNDATRQARRMQKKEARKAMEKSSNKGVKERIRVRKTK
ncbi:hypothetical protein CPB86DRAFT_671774, partial [Serendipita vermifera]